MSTKKKKIKVKKPSNKDILASRYAAILFHIDALRGLLFPTDRDEINELIEKAAEE